MSYCWQCGSILDSIYCKNPACSAYNNPQSGATHKCPRCGNSVSMCTSHEHFNAVDYEKGYHITIDKYGGHGRGVTQRNGKYLNPPEYYCSRCMPADVSPVRQNQPVQQVQPKIKTPTPKQSPRPSQPPQQAHKVQPIYSSPQRTSISIAPVIGWIVSFLRVVIATIIILTVAFGVWQIGSPLGFQAAQAINFQPAEFGIPLLGLFFFSVYVLPWMWSWISGFGIPEWSYRIKERLRTLFLVFLWLVIIFGVIIFILAATS